MRHAIRIAFVWSFYLGLFCGASLATELPDESVLPGQSRPFEEIAANLPDESQLPGETVPERTASDAASTLPGEDQLPPGTPRPSETPRQDERSSDRSDTEIRATDANAPELAGLRLDQSPDELPWLQIEAKGPTAPIRAFAFTTDLQRIFSGGQDKALTVWRNAPDPIRFNQRQWGFERTIHWPIQRGHRGQIQAIAISDRFIAAAGQAAYGGNGDIFLFDSATGTLSTVLFDDENGHREAVVSLSFSPHDQKPALVSADMSGKIVYWSVPDAGRGLWKAVPLRSTDRILLGDETAERVVRSREFFPVVMVDARRIVFPEFWQFNQQKLPLWKLHIMDVESRQGQELVSPNPLRQNYPWHGMMATALAASKDGRRLASADAAGRRFLWTLQPSITFQLLSGNTPVLSLAFDSVGRRLAVGSAVSASTGGQPRIEIYDVTRPNRPIAGRAVNQDIHACRFSPDDSILAYTQGSSILLRRPSATLDAVQELKSSSQAPGRVATSNELPYRIAFGRMGSDGRSTGLTWIFDTRRVQLRPSPATAHRDWRTSDRDNGGWSVRKIVAADSTESYWLYQDRARRGRIPIRPVKHGVPSAIAWLKEPDADAPEAVIVGLSGTNNIHVFRIAGEGDCVPLRHFRGHSAKVNSLAVTHDGRYLVSSSMDGSIRLWPLQGTTADDRVANRWGATFVVRDGAVVVDSIRKDGPLYFRGVRAGDRVTRLRYLDVQMDEFVPTRTTDETLRQLDQAPWDEVLEFQYVRGDAPPKGFQMYPAWQQVVSLSADDANEWAYWSPSGYYDASFEGHKLFGWQVNRGRREAPDYFLAAQFRAALERPQVMERVLEAGNIDDAFRMVGLDAPAQPDQAILDQYRVKPEIVIVPPSPPIAANARSVTIQAEIRVPKDEPLVPPKAFANGVVATDRWQLATRLEDDGRTTNVYAWNVGLPSSHRVLIQVVAATESESADVKQIMLERKTVPPRATPRLFIASIGINQYQDSQIQRLDYAVNNASQVAATLGTYSKSLYRSETWSLLDELATRPMWQVAIDSIGELRHEVTPDDVLVVFMSGHGLRDEQTGEYYYVGVDSRYDDLIERRYGSCLSLADLAPLADVPCRKLVVLDTCHAGAINPDLTRELKSALRMLQDDMIFTLTASEGHEEAVELRERKLGRFTNRLLEALRGDADRQQGNRDGVASFREVTAYVQKSVRRDSEKDVYVQNPTAGPRELLEVADFPLTAVQRE